MNSNTASLSRFFAERRLRGEPLVLASIVHTVGSTYRKAGAHMLIGADGDSAGLLSGGCLEGDLIERARRVISTAQPSLVTYDTRTSDDVIWGIGLGCEGAMTILLTKLDKTNDYQPYAYIDQMRTAHRRAAYALVVESMSPSWPLGRALRVSDAHDALLDFDGKYVTALRSTAFDETHATLADHPAAAVSASEFHLDESKLLMVPVVLPIRLLVLGAGPDVQPLVAIAAQLGWQVTVSDHRPAYAVTERFPGATSVLLNPAASIASGVALNGFDAAVVMSHHLISDQHYLAALADSCVRYIGLLGPAPRRLRLLAEVGERGNKLTGRLRGPVGLDLGASTPETIALAIVSEVQAVLAGRTGRPFTEMAGS